MASISAEGIGRLAKYEKLNVAKPVAHLNGHIYN